jgi:hypothetical protein
MIDIKKHKETNRTLKSPRGNEYVMSEYEICRWMSLIEAVDIIDTKSKQLKLSEKELNWVKPIAIQKYIDERTESMLFEVQNDLAAEELCIISPEQK